MVKKNCVEKTNFENWQISLKTVAPITVRSLPEGIDCLQTKDAATRCKQQTFENLRFCWGKHENQNARC